MTRARLVWGGAAAAILGLGAVGVAAALALTAGPEHHVQRYLDALARDDIETAARLAGLADDAPVPVGDEGEASIRRIIATEPRADGSVAVTAEYGDDGDAVRTTFLLEAAPPTVGVIPAWQFVDPPVTALVVGVDQHDALVVGPVAVTAPGPGEVARVTVLVPSRVTVRLAEPLLVAEPVTLRATGAAGSAGSAEAPVLLSAEPSPVLVRDVGRRLDALLADCAAQPVLKPAGCPFGVEVDDRVTEPPVWRIDERGPVTLLPGDRAGEWRLRADGAATVALTVQRLFDGRVSEREQQTAFTVEGAVLLSGGQPVLQLDPPRP